VLICDVILQWAVVESGRKQSLLVGVKPSDSKRKAVTEKREEKMNEGENGECR